MLRSGETVPFHHRSSSSPDKSTSGRPHNILSDDNNDDDSIRDDAGHVGQEEDSNRDLELHPEYTTTTTTTTTPRSQGKDEISHRLEVVRSALRRFTDDAVRGGITPTTATTTTAIAVESDEGLDRSSLDEATSWNLGLALFGPDPAAVETAVRDGLLQVEQELESLVQEAQLKSKTARSDDNSNSNRVQSSPPPPTTPDQLQIEALFLQSQIRSLKTLGQVRANLDEALFYATTTDPLSLVASSTLSSFPNDALSSSAQQQQQPSLVRAAEFLRRAEECLEEEDRGRVASSSADLADERDSVSILLQEAKIAVQRQRADLIYRTTALWKIELTGAEGGGDGNGSLVVSIAPSDLHAAYDASHILRDSKVHLMVRSLLRHLADHVLRPALPPSSATEGTTTKTPRPPGKSSPHTLRPTKSPFPVAATTAFHRGPWTCEELSGPPRHQGRRFEWTAVHDAKSDQHKDHGNNSGAGGHGDDDCIIAHWKDALNLWRQILEFVADRILLRRSDWLREVGDYLWGPPRATPQSLDLTNLGLEPRRLGDDDAVLREPLFDALRDTCVPHRIPSNELRATIIQRSHQLRTLLEPFAEALVRLGYVGGQTGDDDNNTRGGGDTTVVRLGHAAALAHFAEGLEREYVEKRRGRILQGARETILTTDYHNTVRVGDQPFELPTPKPKEKSTKPSKGAGSGWGSVNLQVQSSRDILRDGLAVFQLPCCNVSSTALESMKLCRAVLDEAVEVAAALTKDEKEVQEVEESTANPPVAEVALSTLPAVLYQSAREVLDLFRAMVPVLYGYEIQNVPRTAAVFHNDCVYLAHHCLTLGLEFRHRLEALHNPKHPSSSSASPGRRASHDSLDLLQRTALFVDMVPLFRDMADKSLGNVLDKHAKELVDVVGRRIPLLGESLRSDEFLVEWSDAEEAVEAGLHHLQRLFQAWKSVLSQEILVRSLWYLADVILTLLLDQITLKARDISAAACPFVGSLFQTAQDGILEMVGGDADPSRVLDRFSAVGRFLNMSLAEVQVALSEGAFRSVTGKSLCCFAWWDS